MIWFRALRWVAVCLAVAAVIGRLFSAHAAAWWLAGAFAIYAIVQAIRLAQVHHWAAIPRKRDLPLATGAWDMVLERIARFAKQENETRKELSTELAQLHAAVDQLPDGLVLIDRIDHVEWFNNAAGELHGIFAGGRPIHHFIRQPEFVDYLDQGEFGTPPVIELPPRPGRLYELRLHRTGDSGKLLITRDVTDHAKLDAMRRDFVANVSHEIRTPVTVIGGFAETLLTLDLDAASRREYLEAILKQSHTMQRLVDDLLALSSLENSESPASEEKIDLRALVTALVDEAPAITHDRHMIEVRFDTHPVVLAAPREIESAIRNLLSNAVRYTPGGGRIAIDWRIRDGEGLLSVRDNGIGIAAQHLPRLTERFYRVDRGRSRETGGTGLGLAIVKHIMSRHGGELTIDSRLGSGSVFTLRFPARRIVSASGAPDTETDVRSVAT